VFGLTNRPAGDPLQPHDVRTAMNVLNSFSFLGYSCAQGDFCSRDVRLKGRICSAAWSRSGAQGCGWLRYWDDNDRHKPSRLKRRLRHVPERPWTCSRISAARTTATEYPIVVCALGYEWSGRSAGVRAFCRTCKIPLLPLTTVMRSFAVAGSLLRSNRGPIPDAKSLGCSCSLFQAA